MRAHKENLGTHGHIRIISTLKFEVIELVSSSTLRTSSSHCFWKEISICDECVTIGLRVIFLLITSAIGYLFLYTRWFTIELIECHSLYHEHLYGLPIWWRRRSLWMKPQEKNLECLPSNNHKSVVFTKGSHNGEFSSIIVLKCEEKFADKTKNDASNCYKWSRTLGLPRYQASPQLIIDLLLMLVSMQSPHRGINKAEIID